VAFKVPNSIAVLKVSGQSDCGADGNSEINLVAGTNVTLTTTPATNSVTIAASGGGGASKQTFPVRLAGRFSIPSSASVVLFTHSSGMGNAMGGDFSLSRSEAGPLDTTFTSTSLQAAYYYTIGVAPFACTLESVSAYANFRYTYTNSPAYRVWKGTYTNGSTASTVTWTEVVSAQSFTNSAVTDVNDFVSTTLSSGNSYAAGDLIGFTFESGGTVNTSLNQFTANLMFLET